jgi:hypothetical protein
MAGAKGSWTRPLAVAALLVCAGVAVVAQSAESGAFAGKLTDLHSAPVGGATLLLRNQATGGEARTTTLKNGAFRFAALEPGEYTLEAESPQLGHGRVESIVVDAGHEARMQTAMEFAPTPPRPFEVVFRKLEPEPPTGPALLTADALASLLLDPRPVRYPARAMVSTEPLLLAATVDSEPMETLDLGSRSLPAIAPRPAILAPAEEVAAIHAEATGGISASGRGLAVMAAAAEAIHGEQLSSSGLGLSSIEAAARGAQVANLTAPLPAQPVLAAARTLDPAATAGTTTLPGEQLRALPATGRRWQDFALETPTATAPVGGEGQISLRGAGEQPAATSVDGINTGLAFGGRGGNRARGTQMSGPGVSEAAIREVQTAAGNAQAEAERAAGGRIDVETQRGGNGLHGQGFLFDRQNTWGARNPFTQWVTWTSEFAPLAPFNTAALFPVFDNFQYSSGQNGSPESYTPPDHETTWGIGLGRQIRRDKLFWFAALDRNQRNDPGLGMVKHPYLVQAVPSSTCENPPCTTGFFAYPGSDQMQVLAARLGLPTSNPVAEGLAAYSPMLETLAGLLGPAPRTAKQWTGFGRLDWQATERHRFTLEGTGSDWNSPGGGLTRVSENYGNHSFGSSKASEEWLLGRWEAFLTPNLLAVTQGSAGREILEARPSTPSDFENTFLTGNAYGQLPEIVVDNRYGFTIGNPSRFGQGSYPDERLYQAQETLDYVRGKLLVKAGFNLSHNADATSLLRNQTGTYTYANVENFISDALVFGQFGVSGELNPANQHNCDQTGKVWRDSTGQLHGLGALPCYSYYSQTLGPTDWHLSTNDWAGFATAQWQPKKRLVISAGLRWEREQLPPPIAALNNPELPLTEKLPNLGNSFDPRFSLAWGTGENHWPVLRLGYGMYAGRTENSNVETALTQTGSLAGDLNFFIRPKDGYNPETGTSSAPPFPYVLSGDPASVIKPAAVEFAPNFRNPEIHQAVAGFEEALPGHVLVNASAVLSLGRRLPISIDTNFDPTVNPGTVTYAVKDATGLGPIKATQITVPFYATWPSATSPTGTAGRLNPDYQQITEIMSRSNSTYEAAMVRVSRYARRGLSLHAHYTYAHAMDWNPDESTQVAGSDLLDPADFGKEYGTSNLDVRHSAAAMVIYEAPWKLRDWAGRIANGWMVSGIGLFRSGLPYTMRTSGSLPEEFEATTGAAIVGLGPGMNGSGGDNRVYGVGNNNVIYDIGRNTYRYPATWKADMRLGKRWDLTQMRQVELLIESFNLFNHQNVTELETTGYYIEPGSRSGTLPTLSFLNGLKADTSEFGQPLNINGTNFYRERQIQVGLRVRF